MFVIIVQYICWRSIYYGSYGLDIYLFSIACICNLTEIKVCLQMETAFVIFTSKPMNRYPGSYVANVHAS